MDAAPKPLAIGGKSAAWLRQVGIRTLDDVAAVGALEAYMRVKRAGFKPSLNLLYALEGVLVGCHWQQVDLQRRTELAAQAHDAIALLPSSRRGPPPSVVTTTMMGDAPDAAPTADAPDVLSF
ncbi:TfoX/Sxy family protein [Cognatilysobacter lacus]|uniref:TfoX/Sxy family protein n=1 Tax=Cognatilysobacter lacus TaxID=1643323 RepID=A0A5D8YWH3_9GAMM|nr:TfoX/Sxy family protein [Lysobacter lacus]TZF86700.1 TfoX/Sxy family protein [Lysobacter lacus]